MAIEKQIIIDVDSKKAEKNLDGVIQQFDTLGKEAIQSIKNIEKNVEESSKATKILQKGFNAVGASIKAMGIGLVLDGMALLKDLFQSNQVIADKFGAAFKTLSIAFNDFFNYINKNADGVVSFFKNIFENPVESLKNFGKLIKENIIERFNSALEVAGFMADALKKLFTGDFKGALESVKEAGKEMVDVFTGIDDTTGKVGKLVDKAVDYAKATWNAAEALQAQENNAKRAAAIQAGLVEEYDRQAETLRQIRDDDSKSIEERIAANNKLADVLQNQRKAMLAQANLQVQAAANQYNLNKSIENEVALIEARNNVKAVEAQITGFVSEQKSNENALTKEAIELAKSRTETETQLAINQKLFEAERLKDEGAKLEAQKLAMENERDLELTRLQNNIELYALGTQARVDAENEFALRKQEIDNGIIAKEDEIAQYRLDKQKEDAEKAKTIAEEERKFKEEQYRSTYDNLQNILSLGGGKLNKVAKALAIADVVRTATKSVSETVSSIGIANAKSIAASPLTAGQPFVTLNTLKGALTIASTVASSIRSIQAIKGESKSAPNSGGIGISGGGGGGSAPAPQFNVVGNSGVNQIAQTLGQQQPVQAYVVANNVTTAQALDRNIVQNASLG